jgi:HAD superfamily hydrolase (TIGR01509 family)
VGAVPDAVVFDLDGVLMDSEQLWNDAKEQLVRDMGGRWRTDAPQAMIGMSSAEWSAYLHDRLGVALDPERINSEVIARIERSYREHVPLLPGAAEAVRSLRARWPLGLASSSNRQIIDLALELAGLDGEFAVTVSSEEVTRGKPAPDVYLEAARRLSVDPRHAVAVEDSSNGMRSAAAAGMPVIAVPNPRYPPSREALELAAACVDAVADVTPELIERVA